MINTSLIVNKSYNTSRSKYVNLKETGSKHRAHMLVESGHHIRVKIRVQSGTATGMVSMHIVVVALHKPYNNVGRLSENQVRRIHRLITPMNFGQIWRLSLQRTLIQVGDIEESGIRLFSHIRREEEKK